MPNTDLPRAAATLYEEGLRLRQEALRSVHQDWKSLELPFVLAGVLREPAESFIDRGFFSLELKNMLGAFVARAIEPRIGHYLHVYDEMVSRGVSAESPLEFRIDGYAWPLPLRQEPYPQAIPAEGRVARAPEVVTVKAFVATTQSANFLVVLNQRGLDGTWGVHVREFWKDLSEELKGDKLSLLHDEPLKNAFSWDGALRLANELVEVYSDDVPGVDFVQRPSLQTYLRGNLVAGTEGAGEGLRYADFRDRGYLLSHSPRGFQQNFPQAVEGVGAVPLSVLSSVLYHLDEVRAAVDSLK